MNVVKRRYNLILLRENRGLLRPDFAKAIGISPVQLSRLENGVREPNVHVLRNTARTLSVTMEDAYDLFFASELTELVRGAMASDDAGALDIDNPEGTSCD